MISDRAKLSAASCFVLLAALGCTHEPSRDARRSIYAQTTKTLAASTIYKGRSQGCQSTLKFWKDEQGEAFEAAGEMGGMLTLGDNYLTYYFVHLTHSRAGPTLFLQSSDTTRQIPISASDLARISQLIADARNDSPPKEPRYASHTSCVVFWDAHGNYFSVDPDTLEDSTRATDRAIAVVSQVSSGAP